MRTPNVPRRPLLTLLLALAAAPLGAQATGAGAVPAPETGALHPFASVRLRGERWNWFDEGDRGEYLFGGAHIRLGLEQQRDRTGWRLELAAPILFGLPDEGLVTPPVPAGYAPSSGQLGFGGTYYAANFRETSAAQIFPKQAFFRLTRRELRTTQTLRVGRFEYADGAETTPGHATLAAVKRDRVAQRMLGPFMWGHVGRSFDGAHFSRKLEGRDLTLLLAAPTRGVFQVDGWGPLPIAVAYGAWTLPYRPRTGGAADARLFGLQYVDFRGDRVMANKADNRNLAVVPRDSAAVAVTSVGGHWIWASGTGAPGTGGVDVTLWGVGQLGSWGELSHRAWAGVAELGLQPAGMPSVRPWLRLGYAVGSGDDDPDDETHGTFFQVLPTPRPYARFPFYDMQNMRDGYAILTLRPSPRLTLRGEAHSLTLDSDRDRWYLGGGAFQKNSFGYQARPVPAGARDLSVLLDVSAEVRITPDFVLSGYLGKARAGEAMATAYPARSAGTMMYLEVERRF